MKCEKCGNSTFTLQEPAFELNRIGNSYSTTEYSSEEKEKGRKIVCAKCGKEI